jgi:hypothetical protein
MNEGEEEVRINNGDDDYYHYYRSPALTGASENRNKKDTLNNPETNPSYYFIP